MHVVVVWFETGDDTHRVFGAWHIEGVYSTFNEAKAVWRAIETGTYDSYKPWEGYYERFERCDIIGLEVVR